MKDFELPNREKIVIDLVDGWYIRNLDSRNWILATKVKMKKDENLTQESIRGYYPTLSLAWKQSCEILALLSENFGILTDLIDSLEEVKKLNFK